MRTFSAILGVIVSIVLCVTGVLMTLTDPLASLLPASVPADLTTYTVPTVDVPSAELKTFEASAAASQSQELPAVSVATVDIPSATGSSYNISNEYLFDYSFGADFYSEIYNASYKIFNQLVEMSNAMDSSTSTLSSMHSLTKLGVQQLNNLAKGFELLAQYSAAQTSAAQDAAAAQIQTVEALSAVSANVSALSQTQTAQLSQLNNNAAGMSRIITMLGLLIRAIGVLVTAMGLTNLCKYLAMLAPEKSAKQQAEA